jgi:hypothetical protein
MTKLLRNVLLLGTIMLLLAACATPTTQPTAAATKTDAMTSTPIVITATDLPATATVKAANTKTPAATNTTMPKITYTPSIPGAYDKDGTPITNAKSSIIITSIKESGSGQAQITWIASGTFANGFKIYYSSSIKNPVFGGEKSEYAISDGSTRSAFVTGTPGTTYNYRLCSFTGSACDFYSNSYSFSFKAATSTP